MATIVDGRKTFIPLENNPEVLAHLCRNLAVSRGLTFHDVLSTSSDLLADIPRPIRAVILLCDKPIYNAARATLETTIPEYHGHGPQEPVLWMKQTIGHACGLMALLHCVFNLANGKYVTPKSQLEALMQRAVGLEPKERAQLLYGSQFLEDAHMDAASQGASSIPLAQDDNHFHFVGFVKVDDGKVWELNGGLPGPLFRGMLQPHEDLLGERGLAMTVKDFLDAAQTQRSNIGVSMVAVGETD